MFFFITSEQYTEFYMPIRELFIFFFFGTRFSVKVARSGGNQRLPNGVILRDRLQAIKGYLGLGSSLFFVNKWIPNRKAMRKFRHVDGQYNAIPRAGVWSVLMFPSDPRFRPNRDGPDPSGEKYMEWVKLKKVSCHCWYS